MTQTVPKGANCVQTQNDLMKPPACGSVGHRSSGFRKSVPSGDNSGATKKTRSRPRSQKLNAKGSGVRAPGAQSTPIHAKRNRDSGETPPSSEQPTRKTSQQPSVAQYINPAKLIGGTPIAEPGPDKPISLENTPHAASKSDVADMASTNKSPTSERATNTSVDTQTAESAIVMSPTIASTSNAEPIVKDPTPVGETLETAASYAEKVAKCDLFMAIIDRKQQTELPRSHKNAALLRLLSDLLTTQLAVGTNPPSILDNRLAGGAMRIKCLDIYARHWLEHMVPKIDPRSLWIGANLEVIEFAKIPKPFKGIGWFPGSCLTRHTNARNILQLLERANQGIRTDSWTILGKECKDAGMSMALRD